VNETDDKIKQEAVDILEANLGRETARLYQKYYEDKETPTVLASLSELLAEFLGTQKEKEIIGSMEERYHVVATI
jgi:hypothetical protein